MKKRYLNNATINIIIKRFLSLYDEREGLRSHYLRFPQIRKLFLKEQGVHKSWYHFFEFQYENQGYIYISPDWKVHKVLNEDILSHPRWGIYLINDFIPQEWDYLVNKYEKKIL